MALYTTAVLLVGSAQAITRPFTFIITWQQGAPDGFQRDMFLINGQFPGPLLEVNQGDNVVVNVQNNSPFNTTLHHHGIDMNGTPWSDGVPGASQYQILPGCGFTYSWTANQHGSFFYHSHSTSQINDGLYGPIVIHPASDTPTPYGLIPGVSVETIQQAEAARIPIVLSDWAHITSYDDWSISTKSKMENLCIDSVLINGKGNVYCVPAAEQPGLMTSGQAAILQAVQGAMLTDKSCVPPDVYAVALGQPGYPVDIAAIPHDIYNGCTNTTGHTDVIDVVQTILQQSKWVMFDIVGAIEVYGVQFSIDEIPMWVIAADGDFIEPVQADSIPITNGQRYTVLAKFDKPKKYTVRVSSTSDAQILYGTSIINYNVLGKLQSTAASKPFINPRGVGTSSSVTFFDPSTARPYQTSQIPRRADATYKLTMKIDDYPFMWAFNETSRLPDEVDNVTPLLFAPQPCRQDNHTITNPANAWVDYIMLVSGKQPPHPVHMHGQHFYVIGSGSGEFTWATVDEAIKDIPGSFNLDNPPFRDTYPTPMLTPSPPGSPPGSVWLALRRQSVNPGVWLMHCHIQSHFRGGMSMIIQDGVNKLPKIPQQYRDYSCGGV
ncbi:multicopper oxidase [Microdochium trichocladiopsis]|uniref:Multicopper oxidase n=1 Tax=Microdochium trichocladiopsis TaxID=1682393 RepID=A0A9P9BPB4_9PEZI|nr:multicopper oxidase [Microdochium trichocladiopsis]KAH7029094.1 multicopper oxidase [Microdochium trichocladiopsis]